MAISSPPSFSSDIWIDAMRPPSRVTRPVAVNVLPMPWCRKSVRKSMVPMRRVLFGDGNDRRQPGHGVQRRGDDAAVQTAVQIMADQFRPHLESQLNPVRRQ